MNNGDKGINSGQPRAINGEFIDEYNKGITLREHFAGLAMQGLVADQKFDEGFVQTASIAVGMADALLKELNQ